ncbi:SDR family oxidoreductase [Aureibacillus halotolerans]|uniref:Nucleoside-diphosphate-sugar epimerase n=1 Tax=Aureibacillus halotolerans TaxID=1508390 RepID=A0A4R6TXN6_9BACI|nr:NAD(P)-dependent oxidoreductase [Aureibacillus halotolerans]TDQ38650.1 nucleoside-diphosphate-sugar epimerase [Aureibacillus halotolerans]
MKLQVLRRQVLDKLKLSNRGVKMLLVTGITGHTGRYFLQELIINNYEGPIRCIVRESSDTSLIDKSGLEIEKFIGDLRDEAFLDKCMKGVNKVVHIVNIRHTLPLIQAAIKNNVQRAICVHTTGIYSKFRLASEEYQIIEDKLKDILSETEINITILRPTMIYGDLVDRNMSKFIKMVDKLRFFPIVNNGKGLIQPVNARDLGKAYYNVLMIPDEKVKFEYVLSGDKPIALLDAFKLINKYLNKKTTFISFPLGFSVFIAKSLRLFTAGKVDYIERVQRMSEDRCFSHEEAKADFKYTPEPFEYGIEREVREYLNKQQVG